MRFFDLFKNKNSNSGISTGNSKNEMTPLQERIYPNTPGIMKLLPKETPRQILEEDFPGREWSISGG